mmetsp:Transcript_49002/g.136181  ORF Transcript_49002/g.136181 Transcript_49002/m.136181 type:complete len:203 (-) Transcript_49002:1299-1907(-)
MNLRSFFSKRLSSFWRPTISKLRATPFNCKQPATNSSFWMAPSPSVSISLKSVHASVASISKAVKKALFSGLVSTFSNSSKVMSTLASSSTFVNSFSRFCTYTWRLEIKFWAMTSGLRCADSIAELQNTPVMTFITAKYVKATYAVNIHARATETSARLVTASCQLSPPEIDLNRVNIETSKERQYTPMPTEMGACGSPATR